MRYHATRPPLKRIMAIDRELHQKWPTDKTLAMSLEVDPRTIRRDLEYMHDQLNAPIALRKASSRTIGTPSSRFACPKLRY